MKLLKLLLILIILPTSVFASHIIGGEIYYECTGTNTYQVTLILYRDCTSLTGFDNPAQLGVYRDDGTLISNTSMFDPDITPIDVEVDNPCLVVPPGICVEQAIYTVSITVPDDSTGFDLVYQRCCRNAGIVNIEAPDATGSTYWQHIPPASEAPCNSSPTYTNYPPIALCVGDPISFDHSATDVDGDSLAYSFYTPFDGASTAVPMPSPPPAPPFGNVIWATGYSDTYPIDASPALAIDPVTGLLTGTATAEGRFVVGINTKEYRDGVFLGDHYRDFQFNIQVCDPAVTATIGVEGTIVTEYYLDCVSNTVNFNNYSTGAGSYLWDFGDGTTSTAFEPVHVYSDTGTYTVTLVANPGLVCADTMSITIGVYNTVTASYSFVAACSGEPVQFNDGSVSTSAGEIISWAWDFGDGSTSTETNPEHSYTTGGIYTVTLTVETDKGCTSTYTTTVDLLTGPDAEFSVDDVCQNEAATFTNSTTIPTGGTISGYTWVFGDGTTSSDSDPEHQYASSGSYDVTLIATSANGCTDSVTHTVNIGVLPEANAGPDDTVSYLDLYTLNGSGVGTFFWQGEYFIGDQTSATPVIRPATTTTYFLTVTSPDGCVGTDTVTIYVIDQTIIMVPNAFSPNGDGINDELFILNHSVGELYEYSIYNRWGELVFTTNDLNKGWDGTYNGKEQDMGIYVYVIRALGLNAQNIQLEGNITLVR